MDGHGAPQYLEGFVDDISERKHAEAAQLAAEMRYRMLVEQIPAVTYIVEFDGRKRTTFISPQIHGLLGYTPEEWLADRSLWFGCIHPDDQDLVQAHARRDADDRRPLDIEFRMIARDGRVRWVHNTATRLLSGPAQSAFSIGMLFDITAGSPGGFRSFTIKQAPARHLPCCFQPSPRRSLQPASARARHGVGDRRRTYGA